MGKGNMKWKLWIFRIIAASIMANPLLQESCYSHGPLILGAGNANILMLHGLGFRVQDLALPLNMVG